MAFVTGSMTQGNNIENDTSSTTSHRRIFEELPEILDSPGGDGKTTLNSNAQQPPQSDCNYHHHRLFRAFREGEEEEETNHSSCSRSSLFAHMNKPSPSELRMWMAETQESVGKIVTTWQHDLIERSSIISDILDHLIQFVVELEGFSTLPPILSAKLESNHGTFESVINVYLHLVLVSLRQAVLSKDKEAYLEEENPKKRKFKRMKEQRLLVEILSHLSIVAEDALRFIRTHKKVLVPACEKMLHMRNDLYYILYEVIEEPQCQIVPLVGHVSLEEIRREEDRAWLEENIKQYKRAEGRIRSYLEVKMAAKDYLLVIRKRGVEEDEDKEENFIEKVEMTVNERLELIVVILKHLGLSIGSSNKTCVSSQTTFLENHVKLTEKFERLVRHLIVEKRKEKLYPENCCEHLKEALCHLEVKFHQVEKILEEIPIHLRRVIGVADQCSRQLIQDFGLEERLELEESLSWTTPIQDISAEFFNRTARKGGGFLPGSCFPYLWRIIAKIFFGGELGTKKLKEFWEEVRTEMEDFQKEIKMKELETGYGVTLKIPIRTGASHREEQGAGHRWREQEFSHLGLAKYAHKQRRRLRIDESTSTPSEETCVDSYSMKETESEKSQIILYTRSPPPPPPPPEEEEPPLPTPKPQNLLAIHDPKSLPLELPQIVNEFKYVCEHYNDRNVDKVIEFSEEPVPPARRRIDNANATALCATSTCCDSDNLNSSCNVKKLAEATHHTDELKKKLDSYLVAQMNSFKHQLTLIVD